MCEPVKTGLVEEKVRGRELFQGHFLHAFQDQVLLPDGALATREYFVHPGAVLVVPFLESPEGQIQVVLERQFRYPVGRVMVEFPAGKLDAGEACFDCARRELLEETGYTAKQWARVGVLHPAIAYSTEFIDIWFARDLVAGQNKLDPGEFLEVFATTPSQLLQWCLSGQVTDGKTLAATLWLQNVISGAWPLDWQSL